MDGVGCGGVDAPVEAEDAGGIVGLQPGGFGSGGERVGLPRASPKKTRSETLPSTEQRTAQSDEPAFSKLPWTTFSGWWAS